MECHLQISYSDFSKRIHDVSLNERLPIVGGIDLTSRCNLRCVHCYIQGTDLKEDHELTYKEICNIFDQAADAGCFWMLLTGGEPMLRADFTDIYHYGKQKGLVMTINTNATLLTPRIADLFVKEPPFEVQVSLYGMTEGTYEKVTGIQGSYARCMQGINLLLERKTRLHLKTMALTINSHEIMDMQRYAEKVGARFKFDPLINARLDGSNDPAKYRLSPQEIVDLDLADPVRASFARETVDRLWRAPNSDRLYVCSAGINSFHIASNGDLNECIMARRTKYNLLTGSFREGFDEVMPRILQRKRTRPSECTTCEMANICGNCSAIAEYETGDPEGKVEWLCQVAHVRAAAFKTGGQKEVAVK